MAQKSSREPAARAKHMFLGPCSRPRDAIAKRSRFYVPFLAVGPHINFQRLATNSARGGRPRIWTQFRFNIIMAKIISLVQRVVNISERLKTVCVAATLRHHQAARVSSVWSDECRVLPRKGFRAHVSYCRTQLDTLHLSVSPSSPMCIL